MKTLRSQAKTLAKERANTSENVKRQNKRANRVLEASTQRSVTEGIVETIKQSNERPSPFAMFVTSATALDHAVSGSSLGTVPYLLGTMAAAIPHLSPGAALSQLQPTRLVCERVIHALGGTDNVAPARAFRLMGCLARRCVEAPLVAGTIRPDAIGGLIDRAWAALHGLEPSKVSSSLAMMYLQAARKFWQRLFNMSSVAEPTEVAGERHGLRDVQLALALRSMIVQRIDSVHREFLPLFFETKRSVAVAASKDLASLVTPILKTLVADLIGAKDVGAPDLAQRQASLSSVSSALFRDTTDLFKATVPREHWEIVLRYVASLAGPLSLLKRRSFGATPLPSATALCPPLSLLLRVLDKLRNASGEDVSFVAAADSAIATVGEAMDVQHFLEVIPLFDTQSLDIIPHRRYLLFNVLRRIAHHDDLGFFTTHFVPRFIAAGKMEQECTATEHFSAAQDLQVLQVQFLRLGIGFCNYPTRVSDDAFRTLAKLLVSLFSTAHVHLAARCLEMLCGGYDELARDTDELDDSDADDEGVEEGEDTVQDFSLRTLRGDDEILNPHHFHGITKVDAMQVCNVFAKYSVNVMPKLCNAAEQASSATSVLSALGTFARVSTPQVMQTVMKGILDMAENVATVPGSMQKAMTSRRRVLLDIAHSIVPQLNGNDIAVIFANVIEPVLLVSSDSDAANATLQKKAYKLLLAFFEAKTSELAPLLDRVVTALNAGKGHTSPASVKTRLRCIGWAIDAHKMLASPAALLQYSLDALDEIVLSTREKSSMTRAIAMDLLGKLLRFAENSTHFEGVSPARQVLHRALTNLAGTTPIGMSCSLTAAAKLMWCGYRMFTPTDIARVIAFGFSLVDHVSQEVRTAAAMFTRTLLKLANSAPVVDSAIMESFEGSPPPLHVLLRAIALVMSQPKVSSSTRTSMRQLVERLLNRYSLSMLEPLFPSGSRKFLQYVAKMQRRGERLKERERNVQRQKEAMAELQRRAVASGVERLEQDNEDGDLDLLDEGAMLRMAAARAQHVRRQTRDNDSEDDVDDEWHMEMAADGVVHIMTKEQHATSQDETRRRQMADRLMANSRSGPRSLQGPSIAADQVNDDRKRRRTEETEDFENEELVRLHGDGAPTAQGAPAKPSVGTRRQREQQTAQREQKRQRLEADIKRGDEFAGGNGAFGDVKKGKHDPFAYVPLNRNMLNKRFATSGIGVRRFKAVVHKGLKGNKAREAQR